MAKKFNTSASPIGEALKNLLQYRLSLFQESCLCISKSFDRGIIDIEMACEMVGNGMETLARQVTELPKWIFGLEIPTLLN